MGGHDCLPFIQEEEKAKAFSCFNPRPAEAREKRWCCTAEENLSKNNYEELAVYSCRLNRDTKGYAGKGEHTESHVFIILWRNTVWPPELPNPSPAAIDSSGSNRNHRLHAMRAITAPRKRETTALPSNKKQKKTFRSSGEEYTNIFFSQKFPTHKIQAAHFSFYSDHKKMGST